MKGKGEKIALFSRSCSVLPHFSLILKLSSFVESNAVLLSPILLCTRRTLLGRIFYSFHYLPLPLSTLF